MKTYIYALIRKEKSILILKRPSDKKLYPNYWNLPGGKLEETESELACIKREVMEEVNMVFYPFIKISDTIDYAGGEKRIVVFSGNVKGTLKLNEEHTDFLWITPSEIKNKKTMPYIIKLFESVMKNV